MIYIVQNTPFMILYLKEGILHLLTHLVAHISSSAVPYVFFFCQISLVCRSTVWFCREENHFRKLFPMYFSICQISLFAEALYGFAGKRITFVSCSLCIFSFANQSVCRSTVWFAGKRITFTQPEFSTHVYQRCEHRQAEVGIDTCK